jgi:hypothetical protein
MTPLNYQTIGSYLDLVFFLVFGLLAVLIPHKLVGSKATEAERQKTIKVSKICGIVLIMVSIAKLLMKISW